MSSTPDPETNAAASTQDSGSPVDSDAQAPKPGDASPAAKIVLCPYCGQTQPPTKRCTACGGLFEPLSRRATQIAMGPWTVRDKAQPFRPGFSYETLTKLIAAGRIGPTTVLRGPTTRQFWSIARNIPGVAHLFGYCHQCSQHVPTDPSPSRCPFCEAPFRRVRQRNELGLQFPTRRAAEAAQRSLNRALGIETPPEPAAGRTPGSKDTLEPSERELDVETHELVAAAESSGQPAEAPINIFDEGEGPVDSAAGTGVQDLIGDVLGPMPPALPSEDERLRDDGFDSEEYGEWADGRDASEGGAVDDPQADQTSPADKTGRTLLWLMVGLNLVVALVVIYLVAARDPIG